MGYRLDQPFKLVLNFDGNWHKLFALLSTMPTDGLNGILVNGSLAEIEFSEPYDTDSPLLHWCWLLIEGSPDGFCALFKRDPDDEDAHLWAQPNWVRVDGVPLAHRMRSVMETLRLRAAHKAEAAE